MGYVSYAIWNNKGGVGKSFLTFVLATEYAYKHPHKIVGVIDMCPQANVSEILLGGGPHGCERLNQLRSQNNGEKKRKTIGGYFDERISRPDEKTGSEKEYITHIRPIDKKNKEAENKEKAEVGQAGHRIKAAEPSELLPDNLYLVCGDPSLELQVQTVNQLAPTDLPENRWVHVHQWIKSYKTALMITLMNKKRGYLFYRLQS